MFVNSHIQNNNIVIISISLMKMKILFFTFYVSSIVNIINNVLDMLNNHKVNLIVINQSSLINEYKTAHHTVNMLE